VRAGGGEVVGIDEQPDALVWTTPGDYTELQDALDRAPTACWVQLPFAGVEDVVDRLEPHRTWTCAKGVYSEPVAEHALTLALACLRRLKERATATTWGAEDATTLYDADVVVLGGGGITGALLDLLGPFRARVTVVRRDGGTAFPGAARTVGQDALHDVLRARASWCLALALTPETEHVIGRRELALMDPSAVLVNVARGRTSTRARWPTPCATARSPGAGLDVTDPEPLPDDSPLWSLPTCLVTPHTANPWQTAQPLLARRITDNVRRFAAGEPLDGLVDLTAGY
jgi:phosphoglycerate dehydrogenase-like enzyme